MIRTSEALRAGIHPRRPYSLRDQGAVETLSRGVYRLADLFATNPAGKYENSSGVSDERMLEIFRHSRWLALNHSQMPKNFTFQLI